MKLNIGGYKWLYYDGYGRFSRGFAQQLIRAGHGVYPFELDTLDDKPAWYLRAQGLDFSHVTLQISPPNEFRHVPGRSVAWSMHESCTLPPGWADSVNQKSTLLLVPSPWLIEVFEDAGVKVPIEVVPGGIDPEETPILGQRHNQPYTFMALADRGNRKGYDLVWSAFYKAFPHDNKDVRLLIKCRPGSLPNLDFSYSPDDRFTVWRADVEHIADVYSQTDAYICPARCEGYGMSQREAAACGIPTVVTRFSGTADDCDEWAIPIERFTLVESGMRGSGGLWAEPSLDEVVEKMRWLYLNQDEAKANALKAAQWLRDNHTYKIAADKLIAVLGKHLGAPHQPEPPVNTDTPEHRARNEQALTALRSNGHKTPAEVNF